ncbi:hypothetical protein R3P38DRAFT_2785927 [Favolaschia claudopus]|uniref:Uncharacterized protein n=1 Tax=Favolaschia claudopus TaxID=2862362 RepID=A0AAW0AUH6_9AGAR
MSSDEEMVEPGFGSRPCLPTFVPERGHENIDIINSDPARRFFVVGQGHSGAAVYTSAYVLFTSPTFLVKKTYRGFSRRAKDQTDGFSGQVQKSCKRWEGPGGVEEAWRFFHDEHHIGGCPPRKHIDGLIDRPVHRRGNLRTAPPMISFSSSRPPPPPRSAPPSEPLSPSPAPLRRPAGPAAPHTPQAKLPLRAPLGSPYQGPGLIFPRPATTPRGPGFSPTVIPSSVSPPDLTFLRNPSPSPSRVSTSSFPSSLSSASIPSSPRTLTAIDAEDNVMGVDDDDDAFSYVEADTYWGVKGIRHCNWVDPTTAVAEAVRRGMGRKFTMISAPTELELEDMHDEGM